MRGGAQELNVLSFHRTLCDYRGPKNPMWLQVPSFKCDNLVSPEPHVITGGPKNPKWLQGVPRVPSDYRGVPRNVCDFREAQKPNVIIIGSQETYVIAGGPKNLMYLQGIQGTPVHGSLECDLLDSRTPCMEKKLYIRPIECATWISLCWLVIIIYSLTT